MRSADRAGPLRRSGLHTGGVPAATAATATAATARVHERDRGHAAVPTVKRVRTPTALCYACPRVEPRTVACLLAGSSSRTEGALAVRRGVVTSLPGRRVAASGRCSGHRAASRHIAHC